MLLVAQTLKCFDVNAFDNYDTGIPSISEEELENILNEIDNIASKYENEFSNIGSVESIINKVKGE